MKKKSLRKFILLVVAALLVSGGTFLWINYHRQIHLKIVHSLPVEMSVSVEKQIDEFMLAEPRISVNMEQFSSETSLSEEFDLLLYKGKLPEGLPSNDLTGIIWAGHLWRLAVNTNVLPMEEMPELNTLDDLESFCRDLLEKGITPLSVGNSHFWPLGIWAQHIESTLGNSQGLSAHSQSWQILKNWYQQGFFLDKTWNKGWSYGIDGVNREDAAMVLLSGNMLSSIPAELRGNYLFLPFPQGKQKNSWRIGAGYTLYYHNDHSRAAEALLSYLLSPQVTTDLTRQTHILFLPAKNRENQVFIPSWETEANNREMRDYNTSLNNYVTGAQR